MKSVSELIAAMPPEDKKRLEKLAAADPELTVNVSDLDRFCN